MMRRRDPDAELKAMRIRRENAVSIHKNAFEERKWRDAVSKAQTIRNYQNQYGALREAHERLPLGLQGTAAKRLQDLTTALIELESRYPIGVPTGPSPLQEMKAIARRHLN